MHVWGSRKRKPYYTDSQMPSFRPPTLPQLCQNYWSLSVRIGKIDPRTPPINASIDTNSDR